MSRAALFLSASLLLLLPSLPASEYRGNVGNWEASFELDWHDDGTVSGSYSYPKRPGVTYRLSGTNPADGVLHLEEYTGDQITARCVLRKRLTDTEIIWEGQMENTDGRRFPMRLARTRGTPLPPLPQMDDYEARRAAIFSRIQREVEWSTFAEANSEIEMVPVSVEGAEHFVGKVKSFRSDRESLVLTFVAGDWDDTGEIRYEGPEVTLRAARSLPIPPASLLGRSFGITVDSDGRLLDVELVGIAISHYRESRGGKLEVRGVIDPPGLLELEVPDEEAMREIMRKAPSITLLPDKLALGWSPDDDLFFRSIRITPQFGIVIQLTGAGPGMLELETVALDDSAVPDNPWISVSDPNQRPEIPAIQRTREAG